MKLGIIGQGFVGSAIREGLKNYYKIYTYDLDREKCNSTHQEVCYESDIIFVCVPTPMRKSGECDTRVLESVVEKINEEVRDDKNRNRPILVIKSTVPPGTTKRLNQIASLCNVCFSPEFLTEANSFDDFRNQSRIIIGGDPSMNCRAARKVKSMFRKPFPTIPIVVTKHETAEMVKYFTNCFLASKVTFANEMYQICEKSEIDYDKVLEYVLYDTRFGKTHMSVPGPDGDYGFGGHCFPKDLNALIHFSDSLKVDCSVLKTVRDKNEEVRENKDWKDMKGRAVSDD
tara:strand:+ start:928 stop:1788 length:861 start_codon:yes stop_codon:yes gene_type:complete